MKRKRIFTVVLSGLFAISSLTGCTKDQIAAINSDLKDIQAQIDELNEKITALRNDMDSGILEVRNEFQGKIDSANGEIETLKSSLNALSNKHDQDKSSIESDYNSKLSTLESIFTTKTTSLQNNIDSNLSLINQLTQKHDEDVASITSDYNDKITALTAAIDALEADYNSKLKALDEKYEADVNALEVEDEELEAAIAELTTKHNQDVAMLVSDYEAKIAAQDVTTRESLTTSFNNSLSALNQQFTQQVTALQTSINENAQELSTFIEQYNIDKTATKADYETKISNLDSAYQLEVASINSQIATLQTNITTLTNQMNQQITEIQNDFTTQINDLTGRVSALEEVQYHTVSFEVNGGYEIDIPDQIVKHGEKATRPYLVEDPGYTYDPMWYVDDGHYTEPWLFMSGAVTQDMTLTTNIDANCYQITLNDNYPGSIDYTKPGLVYSGQHFTCPVPTYAGHIFEGWFYGEIQVTDELGQSLEPFAFASEITLLASWEAVHDGQTMETAFTVEEVLDYMSDYSVGQWSDEELYIRGTFAAGTTYNTKHSSFSGYAVDHYLGSEKPFQVYSAALANHIENKYGADGCLDGAEFIVRGYVTLFQGSDSKIKYEVAFDSGKSTPEIVYLSGATEKDDSDPEVLLVSEALDIIDALDDNGITPNYYVVFGFVNEVTDPWNSTYNNITFTLGDSSTSDRTLVVFRASCTQDLGESITVGRYVRVVCTLQKYIKNNEPIPETKSVTEMTIII